MGNASFGTETRENACLFATVSVSCSDKKHEQTLPSPTRPNIVDVCILSSQTQQQTQQQTQPSNEKPPNQAPNPNPNIPIYSTSNPLHPPTPSLKPQPPPLPNQLPIPPNLPPNGIPPPNPLRQPLPQFPCHHLRPLHLRRLHLRQHPAHPQSSIALSTDSRGGGDAFTRRFERASAVAAGPFRRPAGEEIVVVYVFDGVIGIERVRGFSVALVRRGLGGVVEDRAWWGLEVRVSGAVDADFYGRKVVRVSMVCLEMVVIKVSGGVAADLGVIGEPPPGHHGVHDGEHC